MHFVGELSERAERPVRIQVVRAIFSVTSDAVTLSRLGTKSLSTAHTHTETPRVLPPLITPNLSSHATVSLLTSTDTLITDLFISPKPPPANARSHMSVADSYYTSSSDEGSDSGSCEHVQTVESIHPLPRPCAPRTLPSARPAPSLPHPTPEDALTQASGSGTIIRCPACNDLLWEDDLHRHWWEAAPH